MKQMLEKSLEGDVPTVELSNPKRFSVSSLEYLSASALYTGDGAYLKSALVSFNSQGGKGYDMFDAAGAELHRLRSLPVVRTPLIESFKGYVPPQEDVTIPKFSSAPCAGGAIDFTDGTSLFVTGGTKRIIDTNTSSPLLRLDSGDFHRPEDHIQYGGQGNGFDPGRSGYAARDLFMHVALKKLLPGSDDGD